MKLVMTLLVRDEEDIIETNIDYHFSQGVDLIIATDNLSVDRTPAILEKYSKTGRLVVLNERSDDYAQHRWVTRMARMAAVDHGADWVINNDADEFWWPTEGGDLKTALSQVPENIGAIKAERYNYPITSQDNSDLPFYAELTWRDNASENPLGRPLPHKVCHRAWADAEVAQGNHSVARSGKFVPHQEACIEIMHFPMRSYQQFENKIRLGGAAYSRNTELPENIGITWRKLYRDWIEGKLPSYYISQIPSADTLYDRIERGRYVRDFRLRDYISSRIQQSSLNAC